MNLYEISAQYHRDVLVLQNIDLPPEVVIDTIEGMQGDVLDKLKAWLVVSMNLDAEAEVRAAHAKRMMDSSKALANRAEALRNYVQITIQGLGLALPIKYPEFTVSMQKNPASCDVVDVQQLPYDLKSCTITFTVNPAQANSFVEGVKKSKLAQAVTGEPSVDFKADKKAVLDMLKKTGTDTLPGARLNPPAYRLAVR